MEKMNDFEDFDARVDKYLRHQMTSEEEQAFRLEVELDAEKKEHARITALMVKTMQQEGMKHDKKIISDIQDFNEMQFRNALALKPRVFNLWSHIIKYSVAACVVGIISFGAYRYYEYYQTVSLGNSQYMAYVSDISTMGEGSVRGSTDDTIYRSLEELFASVKESRDLKVTIEKLETLYIESLIETSVYEEYRDDISWNLAIAYLKDGEREKPIPILEEMVKRNIGYPEISQPAQKLIDLIKEL